MGSNYFSTMEIDAIGEILNISLGASATAVSTMLNARVDITTPIVNVVSKEEFEMDKIEPAVGVEIVYVSGLEGNNVMLLKRHDVKVIVEMLMGMQMSDEEFELNEMNISAVCEVMNQMMGASSTALSEFLGKMVNISTPTSFEVKDEESFVDKYFDSDSPKVVVEFTLKIADKLESEFYNVMPIGLAKALVRGFLPDSAIIEVEEAKKAEETAAEPQAADTGADSGGVMSQEAIEAMLNASGAQEAPAADTGAGSGGVMSQEAIEAMLAASEAQEAPAADAGAGSGGVMSQEAIEAMLAASEAQEAPAADAGTGSGGVMSQEAIEAMLGASEAQAAPNMPTGAPSQAAPSMQMGAQPQMTPGMQPGAQPQMTPNMQMGAQMQPAMSPEVAMMQMQMMQQMMQQMQQMQQQLEERRKPAPEPKLINVQAAAHPNLNPDKDIVLEGEQEENMELIMGVPLEISVEIGRTKKFVKDILDFTKGSLVVLDKLAGEQVDLFVNGQCIAKGDVVVVEDNFGIRITEIMKINLATLE